MEDKKRLPRCPAETTLTLIGNKWKILIIRDLIYSLGKSPLIFRKLAG